MSKKKWEQLFWLKFGRFISRTKLKLTINGTENLPKERLGKPLIVVANHFSYWEPPLITFFMPFPVRFMAALEMFKSTRFNRYALTLFNAIPVRRGRVDRSALRQATNTLKQNGALGIFPEGVISPELLEIIEREGTTENVEGFHRRTTPELIRARPGAAFLATQTDALILPVALMGTERIDDELYKPNYRTPVTMNFGPIFGPLKLDKQLRGKAKRAQLDEYGDVMMQRIAELMPQSYRGPYKQAFNQN